MPTLYMTKGLPASGKTTWAREKVTAEGYVRVNKDDLRAMLFNGHSGGKMEGLVLSARNHLVISALNLGKNVICDDTNLNPKHEEVLRGIARAQKASFVVQDFTNVAIEECISRDKKRPNYVGEGVIRQMYYQYLAPAPVDPPAYDPSLPECVICDIDGTVAIATDRDWYDWEKVGQDKPRNKIIDMVRSIPFVRLVFVSGRDSVCRPQTEQWLDKFFNHTLHGDNVFSPSRLFMRPQGDMRKDAIVKRELYEEHIKGKYNVVAIFDDRPQVLRLWRELGFGDRLFNVGDGREF